MQCDTSNSVTLVGVCVCWVWVRFGVVLVVLACATLVIIQCLVRRWGLSAARAGW